MRHLKVQIIEYNGDRVKIKIGEREKTLTIEALNSIVREGRVEVTNILKTRLVQKLRDKNGNIVGYVLRDNSGKTYKFESKQLKSLIYNFRIECEDLKLTSDNRLINSCDKPDNRQSTNTNEISSKNTKTANIRSTEFNSKLVQDILKEVYGYALKNKCSEIELSIFGKYRDQLTKVLGNTGVAITYTITNDICKAVVACENQNSRLVMPRDCRALFFTKALDSEYVSKNSIPVITKLVLDNIDWSKVVYAEEVFKNTIIKSITVSNSEAPLLRNMYGFFKNSMVQYVDFSTFKVPKVHRTTAMFKGCNNIREQGLNLDGLRLDNAEFIGHMFQCRFLKPEFCAELCYSLGLKPQDYDLEEELKYSFQNNLGGHNNDEDKARIERAKEQKRKEHRESKAGKTGKLSYGIISRALKSALIDVYGIDWDAEQRKTLDPEDEFARRIEELSNMIVFVKEN